MNLKIVEELNNIYEPLHRQFKELKQILEKQGFSYFNAGWFNMHSIKYDDNFINEYFPIPVLSVKGVGDIGLNLDHIFIETTISKEKALNLQLDKFNDYNIEIYGVSDYFIDYYQPNLGIEVYKEKIHKSDEKEFHFTIYLPQGISMEKIISVISKLREYEII
ncbi:hypothetical protein DW1_2120 [Proteiniborus sp. DW1]|uniref:DUF3201 domain-containing protein n=1 Tax=Proteiniborus sp. DW1 TaxID=1889883 RepID=UPI00092E1601|nr:DUF3201 domain-containing protein [Proteiniborus sp. DW1]SCG83686.1 hypothetical protein DW1_2120 [Proteiniborus sp. DW1]